MASKKDLELEERLLRKKELEEQVQKASFELAELREKEATIEKPKQIEKEFENLKYVVSGNDLISSDVYSRFAVYDYFNESEGTITPINGLQAQTLFGKDIKTWEAFGKKELGSVYRKADKFTLRFRHLEKN